MWKIEMFFKFQSYQLAMNGISGQQSTASAHKYKLQTGDVMSLHMNSWQGRALYLLISFIFHGKILIVSAVRFCTIYAFVKNK